MKIAVAAMGNTVAAHFGHCENFIFLIRKTALSLMKKVSRILDTVLAFCRIFLRTMVPMLLLPEAWGAAPLIFSTKEMLK